MKACPYALAVLWMLPTRCRWRHSQEKSQAAHDVTHTVWICEVWSKSTPAIMAHRQKYRQDNETEIFRD